jgi:hypothetical protein
VHLSGALAAPSGVIDKALPSIACGLHIAGDRFHPSNLPVLRWALLRDARAIFHH